MDMRAVDAVVAGGMTGGTITTGGEVFTERAADQATIGVVTAAAGVMDLGVRSIDQWRRIAVAVAAGGRGHLDQAVVARNIRAMQSVPAAGMAGRTVATGGEVLTRSTADPTAIGIVAA